MTFADRLDVALVCLRRHVLRAPPTPCVHTNRNSTSPTDLNEMIHIPKNFHCAPGTTFPNELPPLLFFVAENKAKPAWL